jgi:hypothetical protein
MKLSAGYTEAIDTENPYMDERPLLVAASLRTLVNAGGPVPV